MITRVAKVYLEVDDQASAVGFWTAKVGFQLVTDTTYGEERWIEVKPPEQDLLLVLTQRPAGVQRREVPDNLPHANVFFDCDDIAKTHQTLVDRGVTFALPPSRQHFGWWSLFEDHEGSRFALSQWDSGGGGG